MRDAQANPTRLLSLFPDAQPTDFGVGLKATVSWFLGGDRIRPVHLAPTMNSGGSAGSAPPSPREISRALKLSRFVSSKAAWRD